MSRGAVLRMLVVCATGVVCALCASPRARANPAEVFGLGSRSAGLGGAVAARVDDFSAAFYNPAGLAFSVEKTVTMGFVGAASKLTVNRDAVGLGEPYGLVLGATAPAPLGGALAGRVRVGAALWLLPKTIMRVIARLPDEPFYPLYDDRTQRLMVLPAIAVKATPRLSFGLGLNLLAGLGGSVIAIEGPTRALEPRVDEQISTVVKLNLGARWQVADAHSLALVFRQAFSVPVDTLADTVVAGQPLSLNLSANGLYTPDELVVGYALTLPDLTFSADATWARWSGYPGPYVRVTSDLPLVGPLAGRTPSVPWSDAFDIRAAVEAHEPLGAHGRWFLRGGYGFQTSPVPADQPGITNLLDGPKHTFAAGVGFEVPIGGDRLRIDLHATLQLVGSRTLHKTILPAGSSPDTDPFTGLTDEVTDNPNDPATLGTQISNPGYPTIDSGGFVYSGGLTLELSL